VKIIARNIVIQLNLLIHYAIIFFAKNLEKIKMINWFLFFDHAKQKKILVFRNLNFILHLTIHFFF